MKNVYRAPVFLSPLLGVLIALEMTSVFFVSDYFPNKLRNSIHSEVERGPGTSFSMVNLTSFDWERMHVFVPYSDASRINKALGFTWEDAESTGISLDESVSLLVFTRAGSVVYWLRYPRNYGEFELDADGDGSSSVSREDARFVISVIDRGELWRVIKLASVIK